MRFKTGDRVRVVDGGECDGFEGRIVAFLPRHLGRGVPEFFINFDTWPDGYSYFNTLVHQGGRWEAEDVVLVKDMTIGEIADLFGVDPYDVATAALKEA